MKVIVTGGAGFIGSAVIRQYIEYTDHEVVNLDALTYAGNLESLKEVEGNQRYSFEHVDICGQNEKTNLEVVKTICSLLDTLVPESKYIPHESLITYVTDRPGHDLRYAIDASKIAADLGWTPEETFESGIEKTIKWYLFNAEWCKHVQDGSYQRQRLGTGDAELKEQAG